MNDCDLTRIKEELEIELSYKERRFEIVKGGSPLYRDEHLLYPLLCRSGNSSVDLAYVEVVIARRALEKFNLEHPEV